MRNAVLVIPFFPGRGESYTRPLLAQREKGGFAASAVTGPCRWRAVKFVMCLCSKNPPKRPISPIKPFFHVPSTIPLMPAVFLLKKPYFCSDHKPSKFPSPSEIQPMFTSAECENIATLAVIADHLGVPLSAFRIERGNVFYEGGDGLRCACSVGSSYWVEAVAEAKAIQVIKKAMGIFGV